MEKLTAIGSLLRHPSFHNKQNSLLDRKMLEQPKEYWEAVFPELKAVDLPSAFYSAGVSLRLLHIYLDRKKCEGCTGFATCPKDADAKGHQFSIGLTETGIIEQVGQCDFYRKHLEQQQEQRLWAFSGLNEGHRRMTFDNYPDEQKRLNRELCVKAFQFANEYVPGADMKGLYIYGGFGTAKTHLACAILNRLIARKIRVLYVQAEKTFAALSDLYFREKRDGLPTRSEILDKYISADVLVIDELGHENVNESSIWALYTILNGREPERKPVIITSNFSPIELAERYLSRASEETGRRAEALVSRLLWLTEQYEMIGEDYRSRGI
ncbi:ATP-binding protein [Effusibacillus pohliae]|uniref:ATP-binding protein n=1 Tax=Effusibacillus pohliae TaxID=232270 RepID=UPI00037DBF0E|nr:ATP-binding protein [Effusibacillus pohliae]